jgi:archaellum biogenesis ATPase FlaH
MDRRIRPIAVTLGGIPDLRDLVGRDELATEVAADLARGQGVLLTGDRRVGKTSVSRLVEARLHEAGHHVVQVSAERVSFADFIDALAAQLAKGLGNAVTKELAKWRATVKAGPFFEAERGQSTRSLDELLALAAAAGRERRVVLIVDEVPVLALRMEQQANGTGAALLDTLRRVRQTHSDGLAMLLLGSIGFHHVVRSAPGSINDVNKQPVGPVSPADGAYLARCLMAGERVDCTDAQAVAVAIHEAAEGIPYYIQHLVKAARDRQRTDGVTTPDTPIQLVDSALRHEDDPWNLRHYRDRVPEYYPGREDLAYAVLDVLAQAPEPLGIDDVLRLLASTTDLATPSRRALVDLVELLEQDHYLRRVDAASAFRSELVRRAWLATSR